MIDYYIGCGGQPDNVSGGPSQDSNEVVIIIRDGKVITFIQKNCNRLLEGLYGDGI